jgi:uncharacterized protein YggE
VLALFLAATLAAVPGQARSITVAGESRIAFRPNQIIATFSVTASNRDAVLAKKANDEKFAKLMKACRDVGVEPKSLVIMEGAAQPEYRGNEVVSYSVARSATVTLTDMARVDEALTAISKSGAVLATGVTLQNTDHATFETKARVAAAAAARERAKGITEALGARLGMPISVSDGTPRIESLQAGVFAPAADGTVTTSFATKEMVLVAQITVAFDMEPTP